MKKILLVWQEFPEIVRFYAVPLVDENNGRIKVFEKANDLWCTLVSLSSVVESIKDKYDTEENDKADNLGYLITGITWGLFYIAHNF